MVVAVGISSYMLFDPAPWLSDLMELTWMSMSFRIFVVVLAVGGFACSYTAERILFPPMAKWIGKMNARLRPAHKKKRKEYKLISEDMRI
jgi:cation-transporting ATPase 13A2